MNYSELSDFEINILVAKHLHPNLKLIKSNSRPNCVVALDVFAEGCNIWLDYCNEVQDSCPIMLQNDIGIEKQIKLCCDHCNEYIITDSWEASHALENIYVVDKNPLRAAMIVFLMLKGIE